MADTKKAENNGGGSLRGSSLYKIQTLLSWQAPQRPFKKRTSGYFRTSLLIAFLIEVILLLFSQFMLMLVVLALLFLVFAMASVPPHESEYKISTEGFTIGEHFFLWQELYDFYFKRRLDTNILHIRTQALIPGELFIPLNNKATEEQVKTAMARFIPFREVVQQTFMEKSGDWLSKTFPLENPAPASPPKPKVAS